jgi:hypothetical protein
LLWNILLQENEDAGRPASQKFGFNSFTLQGNVENIP